jgi:hypothetical protein
MGFVMSLDIDDFIRLIAKAVEKREEAKAWGMWLAKYPRMTKKTFVPFSQFFKAQREPVKVRRPVEEVLAEAERIRAAVREQKS